MTLLDRAGQSMGRFQPRLTLQTLGRGDGLLGMKPSGVFGPRGGNVTVARVDWVYGADHGMRWELSAPATALHRPSESACFLEDGGGRRLLLRDIDAEATALERILEVGLLPLPAASLQWRTGSVPVDDAQANRPFWTLLQEEHFDDFWADRLPELQQEGWMITVLPGFAHESVAVEAWQLHVSAHTGAVVGKTVAARMHGRPAAPLSPLNQSTHEGSWMLSLGVQVDGQVLDLVPMLAALLQRDGRWLDAREIAAIDDDAVIRLRAPGGKRIDAPAAPLKAIVTGMLELMTDARRKSGPLPLSSWDAPRFDRMCEQLLAPQLQRTSRESVWQLQGEGDLRALAQRLRNAAAPQAVAAPDGLGVTLRPYQLCGLAWLQYLRRNNLAGILADDMGLGKTAQALAHVLLEKQAGRLDCPALVVLPTSLIFNWQAEAARMAPALRVLTLQGPARARDFHRMAEHDLVLTTYALLYRDIRALTAQPFHLLILDEAQTVKNAASRSAGAVRRVQARHRLCITGTPLENHLGELWTQFDFLMPGFLGDARSFMRLWRRPIEGNGETLRAQLLAQRVRPFILRRRKEDVATELPPRIEVIKLVRLQGQQRALYESVRVAADLQVRRVLQRKGFAGAQIAILDALLKLRQVCCDPYLVKGIAPAATMERAKLALLCDMLPNLVAQGRRVLVFSQFAAMLQLVEAALDALQMPWLSLTGATPPAARGKVVACFQAHAAPVLLISLKAGGVGLNLTAADTVIHLDPWWNPAVQEQATARAHRIGQTNTVFVYRLVVEGSIEERIGELQARKAALTDSVLGNDAAQAQKFSADDLERLLAPLECERTLY